MARLKFSHLRRLAFSVAIAALTIPTRAASFFPASAFSDGAAGATASVFLKLPSSARAMALGGACAAACDNSESVFLQPAGLARLQEAGRSDVSASYGLLLAGSYGGTAAYARPIDGWGVAGAGVTYFSAGSVQGYDALDNQTASFTPNDFAVGAAFARSFSTLSIGGGLKLLHSAVADVSGTSLAADLGMQALHAADLGNGALDFGVSLLNLGPPMKIGGASDPLPFRLQAGAAWHANETVQVLLDGNFPVDQNAYPSVGLEWAPSIDESMRGALRLGYNVANSNGIDGFSGMTAGMGLTLRQFRLDYAWAPFGALGMTNRLSLGFTF